MTSARPFAESGLPSFHFNNASFPLKKFTLNGTSDSSNPCNINGPL